MTLFAKRRGIIFILSAPSGAGKTTLINGLRQLCPEIRLSVSCTTRTRRRGELNGRDYRFISKERFETMRECGEFAEYAKVYDFFYGTPRKPLDRCVSTGRDILLDIDIQGARKIKRVYSNAVSIFLLPPSRSELERRLKLRGTDNAAVIRRRLAYAQDEIRDAIKYDYYIINRDVDEAVGVFHSIVQAERAKTSRIGQWRLELLSRRKKP
jgi:guanylate kinase